MPVQQRCSILPPNLGCYLRNFHVTTFPLTTTLTTSTSTTPTLRMVNIDATTPQLKVLKELTEAIASGNIKNIEPLLSKDFTFRSFPKTAELPDLTKEGYIQRFGAGSGVFNKIEVRI